MRSEETRLRMVTKTVVVLALLMSCLSCQPNGSGQEGTNSESESESESESTDTDTDTSAPELQSCEGTVVFEDPLLEALVRFHLAYDLNLSSTYSGELTGEVLAHLRSRIVNNHEEPVPMAEMVNSLYGLECAVNLEVIGLVGNAVSDIKPLSRLSNLKKLYLAANNVTDVSPLFGLDNLVTLDVSYNPIEDTDTLSAIVASTSGWEMLGLEGLGILDISFLAGLPVLNSLMLSNNGLTDLSPLADAPLLGHLYISGNAVSSLEPLRELKLVTLYASNNQIADLSPLAGATYLPTLDLSYNQISDLSPLAASAPSIVGLWLDNNLIEDISLIGHMPMLREFSLHHNLISDVSPFAVYPWEGDIAFLELSYNRIADLEPLLPIADKVLGLNVEHNEISDLGVALDVGATGLAWNKIRDLGPLAGAGPRQLNLAGNPISSLAPVLLAASNGWSPEWFVVSATPLDEVALGYEVPALCELGMNLFFGQDERCLGSTLENPYPVGDAEPPVPSTTVEPGAFCPLEPAFLASHGLPSDDREAADYVVEEPVANEPIVVDSLTGLVWRRCAVGQSWNGATCQGTATSLSLSEALDACADSFGNVATWRLPDIAELQTLVDRGVAHPLPCVEGSVFPGTHPGRHWSKTEVAGSGARASWAVNFYNGTTTIASSMVPSDGGSTAVVRCVSAESSAPSGSRFDTTGSIVHDAWTSLEWQRCPVNATWDGETCGQAEPWFSWAEAFDACLVLGEGWRLPAASELLSLVDYCRREPAMGEPFAGSLEDGSNRGPHWSATQYLTTDAERSVAVDFSTGQTLVSRAKDTLLARCVRSTNE